VRELAVIFRKTWIKRGGDAFAPPGTPPPALPQDGLSSSGVQVISNVGMRSRSHMRHAYLRAIRRAESRISIMNAYFIPDRGLRQSFARAARRGVSVRVIVPSTTDVQAVRYASNLDRRSFLHNLEVALVVIDAKVGADLGAEFEAQLARCNEVLPAEWERRGWWQRTKEWLFYGLRYWL